MFWMLLTVYNGVNCVTRWYFIMLAYSFKSKTKVQFLLAVSVCNGKICKTAPWTAALWNLSNDWIQIDLKFCSTVHFIGSKRGYNEHVKLLQTSMNLGFPAKTHSLSESIIQYVQSEITDDQKIGTTQCQEAPHHAWLTHFKQRGGSPKRISRDCQSPPVMIIPETNEGNN